MSVAISPDVLERLASIRETQRKVGGCSFYESLDAVPDAAERAKVNECERRMWLVLCAAWDLYALELHDAATKPSGARPVVWTPQRDGTWIGSAGDVQIGMVHPHETGGWGWTVYTTPPDVEPAHGVCEFRPDAFAAAEEAHRGAGGRT